MSGSKGSSSQTQNTENQSSFAPPAWALAGGQQAVEAAQQLAQLPFPTPVQPIAGFAPQQQQALQEVQNLQGIQQPFAEAGAGLTAAGSQPNIGQYFGAEAAGVIPQMENIFNQQMATATGNGAQQAGGLSADRLGVLQSNLANQQDLAAGQTLSQLYGQSVGQAQAGAGLEQQAGTNLANIGTGLETAGIQGAQAELSAGNQQQQQQQNILNSQYQNVLQQIGWPYEVNQYLGSMAAGVTPSMGGIGQNVGMMQGNSSTAQKGGSLGSGLGALGALAKGSGGRTPSAEGAEHKQMGGRAGMGGMGPGGGGPGQPWSPFTPAQPGNAWGAAQSAPLTGAGLPNPDVPAPVSTAKARGGRQRAQAGGAFASPGPVGGAASTNLPLVGTPGPQPFAFPPPNYAVKPLTLPFADVVATPSAVDMTGGMPVNDIGFFGASVPADAQNMQPLGAPTIGSTPMGPPPGSGSNDPYLNALPAGYPGLPGENNPYTIPGLTAAQQAAWTAVEQEGAPGVGNPQAVGNEQIALIEQGVTPGAVGYTTPLPADVNAQYQAAVAARNAPPPAPNVTPTIAPLHGNVPMGTAATGLTDPHQNPFGPATEQMGVEHAGAPTKTGQPTEVGANSAPMDLWNWLDTIEGVGTHQPMQAGGVTFGPRGEFGIPTAIETPAQATAMGWAEDPAQPGLWFTPGGGGVSGFGGTTGASGQAYWLQNPPTPPPAPPPIQPMPVKTPAANVVDNAPRSTTTIYNPNDAWMSMLGGMHGGNGSFTPFGIGSNPGAGAGVSGIPAWGSNMGWTQSQVTPQQNMGAAPPQTGGMGKGSMAGMQTGGVVSSYSNRLEQLYKERDHLMGRLGQSMQIGGVAASPQIPQGNLLSGIAPVDTTIGIPGLHGQPAATPLMPNNPANPSGGSSPVSAPPPAGHPSPIMQQAMQPMKVQPMQTPGQGGGGGGGGDGGYKQTHDAMQKLMGFNQNSPDVAGGPEADQNAATSDFSTPTDVGGWDPSSEDVGGMDVSGGEASGGRTPFNFQDGGDVGGAGASYDTNMWSELPPTPPSTQAQAPMSGNPFNAAGMQGAAGAQSGAAPSLYGMQATGQSPALVQDMQRQALYGMESALYNRPEAPSANLTAIAGQGVPGGQTPMAPTAGGQGGPGMPPAGPVPQPPTVMGAQQWTPEGVQGQMGTQSGPTNPYQPGGEHGPPQQPPPGANAALSGTPEGRPFSVRAPAPPPPAATMPPVEHAKMWDSMSGALDQINEGLKAGGKQATKLASEGLEVLSQAASTVRDKVSEGIQSPTPALTSRETLQGQTPFDVGRLARLQAGQVAPQLPAQGANEPPSTPSTPGWMDRLARLQAGQVNPWGPAAAEVEARKPVMGGTPYDAAGKAGAPGTQSGPEAPGTPQPGVPTPIPRPSFGIPTPQPPPPGLRGASADSQPGTPQPAAAAPSPQRTPRDIGGPGADPARVKFQQQHISTWPRDFTGTMADLDKAREAHPALFGQPTNQGAYRVSNVDWKGLRQAERGLFNSGGQGAQGAPPPTGQPAPPPTSAPAVASAASPAAAKVSPPSSTPSTSPSLDAARGKAPVSTNGGQVPQDVLRKAEFLVANRGSPQQLQQFMAQQGYPMHGNWCGEFAAAVVHASGGTPPKGAEVATNWLGYGRHVDAQSVQPGDIAVLSRGHPQGQTGGHVGIVAAVNPDGTFQLAGGNQGRAVATHNMQGFEFRRGDYSGAAGQPSIATQPGRPVSAPEDAQGPVTFEPSQGAPVQRPTGAPMPAPQVGPGQTVRGSLFNDQRTASGRNAATTAGIATPGRQGLGQMYKVTDPNTGRSVTVPKIDVGPARWTGRGVDFSPNAARQLGLASNDRSFPTDRNFKIEPIRPQGRPLPPSANAGPAMRGQTGEPPRPPENIPNHPQVSSAPASVPRQVLNMTPRQLITQKWGEWAVAHVPADAQQYLDTPLGEAFRKNPNALKEHPDMARLWQ